MYLARPYSRHKIGTVFFFAKETVLNALFVYVIALFNLDARVNNRYQVDSFRTHFFYKVLKVRETLGIHGEILEILHVIDVHVYHVKGNAEFFVSGGYLTDILSCLVAPAALTVTESPDGGYVALAHKDPESLNQFQRGFPAEYIKIIIIVLSPDNKLIKVGVTDIELNLAGIVHKKAEAFGSVIHNEEILGSI